MDNEIYNEFIKGINLINLNLYKVNINNNIISNLKLDTNIIKMSVNFKEEKPSITFIDNTLRYVLYYKLDISKKNTIDDNILSMDFSFILDYNYNLIDDKYKEELSKFFIQNAVLNAWPFVREFVSYITSSFGLAPIILKSRIFNNTI